MKKSLFLAVFATICLASCTKSEIEYDSQPQEISLFAVNKVATKAPVETTAFPNDYDMMVAAYLAAGNGVTAGRDYFKASRFEKNGSFWTGGMYWPISAATLNFHAVAPQVANVVATDESSTAAQSVTTVNDNDTWNAQYDVMYAAVRASKDAATPPTDVDMTFKHAYSLIDFNFKKASLTPSPTITINSITIYGVACDGILTVNVANSTDATGTAPEATHVWNSYTPENIAVPREPSTTFTLTTTNQRYYKGIMLIPNAFMNKFVINYTIDGQTFDYTYVPASSTWAAGTKYIYNITMTPSLIQVDPTVTVWGNDSSNNKDIELDTPPTP